MKPENQKRPFTSHDEDDEETGRVLFLGEQRSEYH